MVVNILSNRQNTMAIILFLILLFSGQGIAQDKSAAKKNYALVIHGGAGVMHPGVFSAEKESLYHSSLLEALKIGEEILKKGGTSLNAVEAVIVFLENDSLFNAGKGAVFTYEGINELDASIMDGNTMDAGAVAGVRIIKNPIVAARAVMEKSDHILLIAEGAESFAKSVDLELVDPSYFFTFSRYNAWKKFMKDNQKEELKKGTVGCVALDKNGNLAAGTSTGGMTGKKYGRVGDTPIIGAGTYADNNVCAISCTGHGEFFIRYSVAKDIASLVEYKGLSLENAASFVIEDKLVKAGGEGGIIGIDPKGNIVMSFNTPGMFRGYCTPESKETFIFK